MYKTLTRSFFLFVFTGSDNSDSNHEGKVIQCYTYLSLLLMLFPTDRQIFNYYFFSFFFYEGKSSADYSLLQFKFVKKKN